MSKKTYTLKFECLNCFYKWEEKIPFGEDVNEGVLENYHHHCGKGIYCSNCGSGKTKIIRKEKYSV